jgi:hypothetical protein
MSRIICPFVWYTNKFVKRTENHHFAEDFRREIKGKRGAGGKHSPETRAPNGDAIRSVPPAPSFPCHRNDFAYKRRQ